MTAAQPRLAPLVLHVVYRFDTGGLENGVVNLINHMPREVYRHAVVAMTEVVPAFAARLRRDDVELISLRKPPGHGIRLYPRLWSLLRAVRPAVIHTRNLAALEVQPVAAAVGVPGRIHGEHGRDIEDIDGTSRRHQRIRRCYSPFVHRYVALSRELQQYLEQRVGVSGRRIAQIYNGVDAIRFSPAAEGPACIAGCPFRSGPHWIAGTVGRMLTIKAQPLLARAFVRALELRPQARQRLRLVMVGDGPLRAESQAILDAARCSDLAWLPGERADVPDVMRGLDCFVLPSFAEGISNTILEAMATGLPVLATAVGGTPEIVDAGRTGQLVPAGDADALAAGLLDLAADPRAAAALGQAGRRDVEQRFSLQSMVAAYQGVYDSVIGRKTSATRDT